MRIGLFGGTFDPPHIGHLLAASDACDLLALDRLVFIPAAQQPLKLGTTIALPHDRLAMLLALIEGDRRFEVDPVEIHRSGLSFTVETLEVYAERYPGAERFFCVGVDALATLHTWRDPARVMRLARLAVLTRSEGEPGWLDSGDLDSLGAMSLGGTGWGGASMADADVLRRVREVSDAAVGTAAVPQPVVLATRRIDVSSTEIRDRLREGKPVRGFLTEAVARYIELNGLYRAMQGSE